MNILRQACLWLPVTLGTVVSPAVRAALADPTRPLMGGGASTAAPAAASGRAVAASAPASTVSVTVPTEPQLQSLHMPREGEPSALVDGQLLRVGQRLGAFQVLAIEPQGVLANGPGGRQRWTLLGVQYLDPRQEAHGKPRVSPAVAADALREPVGEPPAATSGAVPPQPGRKPVHDAVQTGTVPPAPPPTAPPRVPEAARPASMPRTNAVSLAQGTTPVRVSWADLIGPAPTAGADQGLATRALQLARWMAPGATEARVSAGDLVPARAALYVPMTARPVGLPAGRWVSLGSLPPHAVLGFNGTPMPAPGPGIERASPDSSARLGAEALAVRASQAPSLRLSAELFEGSTAAARSAPRATGFLHTANRRQVPAATSESPAIVSAALAVPDKESP